MCTCGHIDGNNRHWRLLEWGVKSGARIGKWTLLYHAHYLGDEIICILSLSITQYIHITNLDMSPSNMIKTEVNFLKRKHQSYNCKELNSENTLNELERGPPESQMEPQTWPRNWFLPGKTLSSRPISSLPALVTHGNSEIINFCCLSC